RSRCRDRRPGPPSPTSEVVGRGPVGGKERLDSQLRGGDVDGRTEGGDGTEEGQLGVTCLQPETYHDVAGELGRGRDGRCLGAVAVGIIAVGIVAGAARGVVTVAAHWHLVA